MDPKHSRTVAIIQARLGSTRLPRKVLRDIAGKTMIERVVERVQQAKLIDDIVIATTTEPCDVELIEFCERQGWNVFAGSEHDVLSRYVKAATHFDADNIVRITSDCPLLDSRVIDEVISALSPEHDYACNFHPERKYPRGLDCEILTRSTLNRIDKLATEQRFREHVTLFIYQNEGEFSIGSTACEQDNSHLRWTVDTPEDLELVRSIYDHFGRTKFDTRQIISAYNSHQQWLLINQNTQQKVA
ncbi:MAG: NTP transferase domain-containing protein [Mariniblastus sp.]